MTTAILKSLVSILLCTTCLVLANGCVDDPGTTHDRGDVWGTPTDTVIEVSAPALPVPPPERIGDFCVTTCDATTWDQEGGGDDQCEAVYGTTSCCLADGLCHRGVRFHGPCFALDEPPANETCPEDANDNGVCAVGDVYYFECE